MNNYQISYDGILSVRPGNLPLTDILSEIMDDYAKTDVEPDMIVLPSGMAIEFNFFLAHQFVAEGRINQDKFLQLSTLQ